MSIILKAMSFHPKKITLNFYLKNKKSVMKKVLPTPSLVSMEPKFISIYFTPTLA